MPRPNLPAIGDLGWGPTVNDAIDYIADEVDALAGTAFDVTDQLVTNVITDPTSDASAAVDTKIDDTLSVKQGAPNGLASLGSDSKVPDSQIPARLSDSAIGNTAVAAVNGLFTVLGFNMSLTTGPARTITDAQNLVAQRVALTGGQPFHCTLVFHAYVNAANSLQLVEFGSFANGTTITTPTPDMIAVVAAFIAAIQAANGTIDIIKLHCPLGYDPATYSGGASQFWTDYTAIATSLATRYQGTGIPKFSVTNEFPLGTGNAAYATQYLTLINAVKAKGFAVGITANTPSELIHSTQIDALDWYGCNMYPFLSNNGAATTEAEIIAGWVKYGAFDLINGMRRRYPTKPFYITEIGTQDTWQSLASPGTYTFVDTYPNVGGAAKTAFWIATLDAFLQYKPDLAGMYAWDDGSYSLTVDTHNANAPYANVIAAIQQRTNF